MSVNIEFFGFPGAGKSTVADAVMRAAASAQLDAERFVLRTLRSSKGTCPRGLLSLVAYVHKHRLLVWSALTRGRFGIYRVRRTLVLMRFLHALESSQTSARLVVLEEGALQALWSLGSDRWRATDTKRFFESLSCSMQLIYVRLVVSPKLAAERIAGRAKSGRYDAMERDDLMHSLNAQEKRFAELTDRARERHFKVLEFSGQESAELVAARILSAVSDQVPANR